MDNEEEFEQALKEYEEKVGKFMLDAYRCAFGFSYEISDTKTLRNERSLEHLVENLSKYEKKYPPSKKILDSYSFLKLVLENDTPLFEQEFSILGFLRDRSGLYRPQKNAIAVQAAGQVLWYLIKNMIPKIVHMREVLETDKQISSLLELNRFSKERTLNEWLKNVFPVPKDQRRGGCSKIEPPEAVFNKIITIPGIFSEKCSKINILKLKFAVQVTTRVLRILEWDLESIKQSEFIQNYKRPLKFYPLLYVNDWVAEAFLGNCSIFS